MTAAVVRIQENDVQDRLKEIGLEKDILIDVVRQGHLAYIGCTANHPPLLPGILAWGETVRALREALFSASWSRSDDSNYSLVISPNGEVAIAVATGDEYTGLEYGMPSNKARKGSNTRKAVNYNQYCFEFGSPENLPDTICSNDQEKRSTWILLVHRDAPREVRCELSLPDSIKEGHIDSWKERIILGSFPFAYDVNVITSPEPPTPPSDITIDIKRRA